MRKDFIVELKYDCKAQIFTSLSCKWVIMYISEYSLNQVWPNAEKMTQNM